MEVRPGFASCCRSNYIVDCYVVSIKVFCCLVE
jgi:hypothetical protein